MNIIEYKLIETYSNKFSLTPKKYLKKKNVKFSNSEIKSTFKLPKLNFNSIGLLNSINPIANKKIVMMAASSDINPNYILSTRNQGIVNQHSIDNSKKNFQTLENKR